MQRLVNKTALLTGGASGMGEAHARRLVAEGARVVFTDINEDAGQLLAKELGANAAFCQQDVSSEADWERVGTREEVSALVVFLASDESAFITGADHLIDGGNSLS